MKQFFFVVVGIFCVQGLLAQQSTLEFKFLYDGNPVSLGKNYFHTALNDSISFDAIKCYISQLKIQDDQQNTIELAKKHFLVDVENPSSCTIDLPKRTKIKTLQFLVGVDSLSNANAIITGDLDPINGMYWAWQSGFINWKIEGKCNSLSTRNHVFQFHIGGFLPPFQTTRKLELINPDAAKSLAVIIDLKKLFQEINLQEMNEIMSTNKSAVLLADFYSSSISLSNE